MSQPWWVRDRVKTFFDNVVPAEPHEAAWRFGEKLHSGQGEARRALADAALFFLYGSGTTGLRGSRLAAHHVAASGDPPFRNVVRKCVNTKTAMIFRNRVRCFFLTDGANVEDQEKAQAMTRGVEAQFTDAGIYARKGYRICQDGQAFHGGVGKVVADIANNRVLIDRCFPWEIYVPQEEARAGEARQFGHRQLIERSVLAAMFPEHVKEIASAPPAPDEWMVVEGLDATETSDLVAVWELWHLPSGRVDLGNPRAFGLDKDRKLRKDVDPLHDGRHVIVLEGATLLDRPWPFPYPPLAFYLPQPDPVGFWSLSLPESLQGIQLELIRLGRRIQSCIRLHAVPRLGVDRRAKVNVSKLTNDLADIIEANGPPASAMHYLAPGAVPSDLFRREQELDDLAMQESGIPEMAATGEKPKGVDHAPGMQHLSDETSVRHTSANRAWEDFHVQLGNVTVDCGFRQVAEHNHDFSLMWGGDEQLERIEWRKVDLGRGKYIYRNWPTNLLPSMPGPKISRTIDLANAGAFDETPKGERMRAILEYPDTKAAFGDPTAVQRRIAKLLDSVELYGLRAETMPSPFNRPAECMRMAEERINKREADGVSDERIDHLRDFHEAARRVALRMQAEEVQAAQGIAPGAAPPGPPPAPAPPAQP